MTEDDFEPAVRELCPDGTCIGLIGPDGRCKVCGAVGASAVADPRVRGMRAPRGDDDGEVESELDSDRELCPDGSCVGVIGPDGKCGVCGKRAADGAARGAAGGRESGPEDGDEDGPAAGSEPDSEQGSDDDDRELCPDGSCVGLVGPDGRCKVCGTARTSPAP